LANDVIIYCSVMGSDCEIKKFIDKFYIDIIGEYENISKLNFNAIYPDGDWDVKSEPTVVSSLEFYGSGEDASVEFSFQTSWGLCQSKCTVLAEWER
jgi:hypothetical protein